MAASAHRLHLCNGKQRQQQNKTKMERVCPPTGTRNLTPTEIDVLERTGNSCLPNSSWTGLLVAEDFDPAFVKGCTFGDNCTLGSFASSSHHVDGATVSSGVYHSTLVSATVCDGALVSRTTLLSRCVVGPGAAVVGCGTVCMKALPNSSFANGSTVNVAIETGGREVPIFAEMTLEDAARVAGRRSDSDFQQQWRDRVSTYARQVSSTATIVGAGAQLLHCPRIEDAFIGSGAIIEASRIINATVLSTPMERTVVEGGCLVEDSIVQWSCRCSSMAIVSNSFMCATSHVERHAKLLDSILGPCSGASEGEISASLVGYGASCMRAFGMHALPPLPFLEITCCVLHLCRPFVGFHHQALLIACYWPAGRGNIGYGANVGSNHTGKAPDQEIWPGEGVFFGLDTAIKFPSNFSRAPYTLIATGVSTLPQRVEMPFSLINTRGAVIDGVSPSFNEIFPGWVLSDNMYMVLRGETKYKSRGSRSRKLRRGRGYADYDYEAFRPEIVELLVCARDALTAAGDACSESGGITDGQGGRIYTSKQIPGLGKNYMTERSRLRGVRAYSDAIEFYALRTLWRAIVEAGSNREMVAACRRLGDAANVSRVRAAPALGLDATSTVLRTKRASATDEWRHYACHLAASEAAGTIRDPTRRLDVAIALNRLKDLQWQIARGVLRSKQKDDRRGPGIIDDYSHAHPPAQVSDPVVIEVLAAAERLDAEVTAFLLTVSAESSSKLGSGTSQPLARL